MGNPDLVAIRTIDVGTAVVTNVVIIRQLSPNIVLLLIKNVPYVNYRLPVQPRPIQLSRKSRADP